MGKTLLDIDVFNDFNYFMNEKIACIGNNTGLAPAERDYNIIEGFSQAAKLIFEKIEDDTMFEDTGIYPFAYCARHSIELYLKYIFRKLKELSSIKFGDVFYAKIPSEKKGVYDRCDKIINAHDIEALASLINVFGFVDRRISVLLDKEPKILDMLKDYYFDEKSDSFRYTYKTTRNVNTAADSDELIENVNFAKEQKISITALFKKFEYTLSFFDILTREVEYLINEYRTKTYTYELSRKDIEEISLLLPNRDNWTSEEFIVVKKDIIDKFKISGRNFSDAVNMIKNHPQFSVNIGIEICLAEIRDEALEILVKLTMSHNEHEQNEPQGKIISVGDILFDNSDYYKRIYGYIGVLTNDEKIALLTFHELAKYKYHCEDFNRVYLCFSKGDYNEKYLFQKYRQLNYIKQGFVICGQHALLKKLDTYAIQYGLKI